MTKPVPLAGTVSRTATLLSDIPALARAGLIAPVWPDVLVRAMSAVVRHGLSPAAAYEYNAARFGSDVAIVDDRGVLTFSELSERISALSASLERCGIGDQDRVGVLCRNHSELVETVAALSGIGADIVLLNVSFAAPQLAGVIADERVTALVHDEEFAPQARSAAPSMARFVARHSEPAAPELAIGELDRGARRGHPMAPRSPSRFVLLTSGTTGRPKGTSRAVPLSLDPVVAMLSRVPLRVRDVTMISSPLFHAWGLGQLGLSMLLSSTVVLQSHFDPESTLKSMSRNRVRVLVAVPFVLQRLLEVPRATRRRYDLSSLEVVMTSGSQLAGSLAAQFMHNYGEVLYNVYGTTEAAWGAIATPADLRAAPGTVGFPPRGADVLVVGEAGHELPPGTTGRVLVRNRRLAASRPEHEDRAADHAARDGFVPTGDLGHFDDAGRLFIDGRQDDMIVSGGENVFPQEVEELLTSHPAITEAVVTGVPDSLYGERLRARIVLRRGCLLSSDEVRAFVKENLAGIKVPRDVEFVDALERNETGKILHENPPVAPAP